MGDAPVARAFHSTYIEGGAWGARCVVCPTVRCADRVRDQGAPGPYIYCLIQCTSVGTTILQLPIAPRRTRTSLLSAWPFIVSFFTLFV